MSADHRDNSIGGLGEISSTNPTQKASAQSADDLTRREARDQSEDVKGADVDAGAADNRIEAATAATGSAARSRSGHPGDESTFAAGSTASYGERRGEVDASSIADAVDVWIARNPALRHRAEEREAYIRKLTVFKEQFGSPPVLSTESAAAYDHFLLDLLEHYDSDNPLVRTALFLMLSAIWEIKRCTGTRSLAMTGAI